MAEGTSADHLYCAKIGGFRHPMEATHKPRTGPIVDRSVVDFNAVLLAMASRSEVSASQDFPRVLR